MSNKPKSASVFQFRLRDPGDDGTETALPKTPRPAVVTETPDRPPALDLTGKPTAETVGHGSAVHFARLTPDGRTAFTRDGIKPILNEWDVTTGQLRRRLDVPADASQGLHFATDGRTLFAVARDRTLRTIDLASGRETRRTPIGSGGPHGPRAAVAFPDGAMVEMGGEAYLIWEGAVRAWTPGGYTLARRTPTGRLRVLTPRSICATIAAGYRPAVAL